MTALTFSDLHCQTVTHLAAYLWLNLTIIPLLLDVIQYRVAVVSQQQHEISEICDQSLIAVMSSLGLTSSEHNNSRNSNIITVFCPLRGPRPQFENHGDDLNIFACSLLDVWLLLFCPMASLGVLAPLIQLSRYGNPSPGNPMQSCKYISWAPPVYLCSVKPEQTLNHTNQGCHDIRFLLTEKFTITIISIGN